MRIIFLLFCFFLVFSSIAVRAGSAQQYTSLEECVAIALTQAPSIKFAEAGQQASKAELNSAHKDLLPVFSAGYTYNRQFYEGSPFFPVDDNYFAYSLQIEQPLYKGRSLVTGVRIGELQLQSSELSFTSSINDLVLQVKQAYFNHLKDLKLEEVARQAIVQLQSHLKDSQAFYEAGLIPKNDMLQSEVQLSQGQLDYLQAQNASELSRASLNLLMGRAATEELLLRDYTVTEPLQVEWDFLLTQALSQRPELIAARTAVDIAEKDKVLVKAPYLPDVSVSASYLKQGYDFFAENYEAQSNEIKQAQLNLNWRFWSWGQKNDQMAAASARKLQAEKQLAQLVDTVTLQARDAYLNLQRAWKNIEATLAAVGQAEENFRINNARYQTQLNTSTQVLDAQNLLSRARANYYSSIYDYAYATARIDWVTGKPH